MTASPDGNARFGGSLHDPSGFIFHREGTVYRQVHASYEPHFQHFIESGLRAILHEKHLLLPFEDAPLSVAADSRASRVLQPRKIPFVSYPYEWCFSQLRDAALATLKIQRIALDYGMTLKDATPFNIQLLDGKLVLIDHLSFEIREDAAPWIAYRQFCETFFAPLALAALRDLRLMTILRSYPDGIPLDLTARLLPKWSLFNLSRLMHIGIHGWLQHRDRDGMSSVQKDSNLEGAVSGRRLGALLDSLERGIKRLPEPAANSSWSAYGRTDTYVSEAAQEKERFVREVIGRIEPDSVWDFGANTGFFARLAAESTAHVVAADGDAGSIENIYRTVGRGDGTNLVPIVLDLCNPSPSLGWAHEERLSLTDRGPATLVMALALVHHLVFRSNIPIEAVVKYFGRCGRFLLIEYVGPEDTQVRRMLAERSTTGHTYDRAKFESALAEIGQIESVAELPGSHRRVYLVASHSALQ